MDSSQVKIGTLLRMCGNIAPAFIQRGEADPKQIAQQSMDVVEEIVALALKRQSVTITPKAG